MKKILLARVFLGLVSVATQNASAGLFNLTAAYYDDASTFSATYEDLDGDGLCTGCNLIAATATLGTLLQDAVDADTSNRWAITLPDLLDEGYVSLDVVSLGFTPTFFFIAQTVDFVTSNGLSITDTALFGERLDTGLFASILDSRLTGTATSIDAANVFGGSVSISRRALSVAEPSALPLLGLGIAGLGWAQRKSATHCDDRLSLHQSHHRMAALSFAIYSTN